MTTVIEDIASVYRDYSTFGDPGSPPHRPVLSEIRGLLGRIAEEAGSAVLDVSTMEATWNDGGNAFTGIGLDITDTASSEASRYIDVMVGGGSVFSVRKGNTGFTDLVISKSDGTSLGGIGRRGNAGEMALTSQVHPSTGFPADVLRWYWEGAVGEAAVLRGMGTNRFSIESAAAMVHIAQNGRFEWEGLGSSALQFVGFEAASSNNKSFSFNNWSTNTPKVLMYLDQSSPTESLIVGRHQTAASTYTNLFSISGSGAWSITPASVSGSAATSVIDIAQTWNTTGSPTAFKIDVTNTASGAGSKLLDLQVGGAFRFSVDKTGVVNAVGVIGSQTALRVWDGGAGNGFALYRGGTGKVQLWDNAGNLPGTMFIFGSGTNAHAALKRDAGTNGLQARLGDDSGFTWLQGKLRTDSAYSAGAPTATGYLTLYDANGTAYKVPAVAA